MSWMLVEPPTVVWLGSEEKAFARIGRWRPEDENLLGEPGMHAHLASAPGRFARRAVLLDRDGVLNRCIVRDGRPYPPSGPDEVEILPGVPEAIERLRRAGFLTIVVTNQPDVARGAVSRETVEAIHDRLRAALPLDDILTCCHDDADRCECRKPLPGLLHEAARRHGIDLAGSYLVGDRWRDIEAGQAAGCRTIWIDYGYRERRPASPPDATASGLPGATAWILEQETAHRIGGAMKTIDELKVKIFADGADKADMLRLYADPRIRGFTTNPTLMRKAGVTDYEAFARDVLRAIPDRPISFEVFSDEFDEMEEQARRFAEWGDNVYVKIPVTNTRRESSAPLVRRLARAGVKVNVTALMTLAQVRLMADALRGGPPAYVSVFAGRIADSGRDPLPIMSAAVAMLADCPNVELIWASPRELLNIFQADQIGCHVITVTHDLLKKLALVGKDLDEFSLETVKMFRADALAAGFELHSARRAA